MSNQPFFGQLQDKRVIPPPDSEWMRCRHWIEDALVHAGGTHTIEDVEDGIAKGEYQFWAGNRAAIVTNISDMPRQRILTYWLIGGDLKELQNEMEPKITDWARRSGCAKVIGIGRKGFERVFAKSGFKYAWTFIEKDLRQ